MRRKKTYILNKKKFFFQTCQRRNIVLIIYLPWFLVQNCFPLTFFFFFFTLSSSTKETLAPITPAFRAQPEAAGFCSLCSQYNIILFLSILQLIFWGFPGGSCQCRIYGIDPRIGKIPWRRKWQGTPVFLPGKCLAGCSPWGHKSQT